MKSTIDRKYSFKAIIQNNDEKKKKKSNKRENLKNKNKIKQKTKRNKNKNVSSAILFHHTTCKSTCDTPPSSAANLGDSSFGSSRRYCHSWRYQAAFATGQVNSSVYENVTKMDYK